MIIIPNFNGKTKAKRGEVTLPGTQDWRPRSWLGFQCPQALPGWGSRVGITKQFSRLLMLRILGHVETGHYKAKTEMLMFFVLVMQAACSEDTSAMTFFVTGIIVIVAGIYQVLSLSCDDVTLVTVSFNPHNDPVR